MDFPRKNAEKQHAWSSDCLRDSNMDRYMKRRNDKLPTVLARGRAFVDEGEQAKVKQS
jgi:hypothetical protein